jgi:hypothetical protein
MCEVAEEIAGLEEEEAEDPAAEGLGLATGELLISPKICWKNQELLQ